MLWQTLLGLSLLLASVSANAHSLGTSYSHWTLDKRGANVLARVPQLQISRLQLDLRYTPNYLNIVGQRVATDLQLWAGEQRCLVSQVHAHTEAEGWVAVSWRVDCPSPNAWLIRTRLFEVVAPSNLHFVRVDQPGLAAQQRVLSFGAPTLDLKQAQLAPSSIQDFIAIGIHHILSGWDHLAFILMLILLARSLREVALVATGFTVAHSLTLAAASLGWVVVEQARVEALIGFSIALVATENLWLSSARDVWIPRLLVLSLIVFGALSYQQLPLLLMAALVLFSTCYFALLAQASKPQQWRLALTFIFGLVHGFGFAGLMGQLQLPKAELTIGLLGFNIGVELGQLMVIALIWPLLLILRRSLGATTRVTQSVSAAVTGLGTFWFITRLLA